MTKRAVKKKNSVKNKKATKHKTNKKIYLSPNESKTEKILIENFVSLQKVMTNLSIKFDSLTKQISKLLELFEISAKALAEKDFDVKEGGKNKKIIEKIDNLLEQNKIIARGLTLMHEKLPEQKVNYPSQGPQPVQQSQTPKPPIPKFQVDMGGYQRSISSRGPNESSAAPLSQK